MGGAGGSHCNVMEHGPGRGWLAGARCCLLPARLLRCCLCVTVAATCGVPSPTAPERSAHRQTPACAPLAPKHIPCLSALLPHMLTPHPCPPAPADDFISWVNDLERDPRYSHWPTSLDSLLMPMPGEGPTGCPPCFPSCGVCPPECLCKLCCALPGWSGPGARLLKSCTPAASRRALLADSTHTPNPA